MLVEIDQIRTTTYCGPNTIRAVLIIINVSLFPFLFCLCCDNGTSYKKNDNSF